MRLVPMFAVLLLSLAGCSPASTPAEPTPLPEDEPAPQVATGEATELRDAIQTPLDKARAAQEAIDAAAEQRREAIESAESSNAEAH